MEMLERTKESYQPSKEDLLDLTTESVLRGDFMVYQGEDLINFFACDAIAPRQVSEICLVNDHFILVKLPQMEQRLSQSSCSIIKGDKRNEPSVSAIEVKTETKRNTNVAEKFELSKYLHCNSRRSRRVAPIQADQLQSNSSKSTSGWKCSSGYVEEVFHSRTTITKRNDDVMLPEKNSTTVKESSAKSDISTQTPKRRPQVCAPRQVLTTSLSNSVELEVQRHVIMSTGTPRSMAAIEETEPHVSRQCLPRPRRSLVAFRWFLRPFRISSKPSLKVKSNNNKKIHAVIYKTYFVNWANNAANVDSRCPSCRRIKKPLRRSRSATF